MTLTRRDWLLIAIAGTFAAVCVSLGVWQLDRLRQRRARNAVTVARLVRTPLELPAALPPESLAQRPIHARGVFDYEHERVWPGRSFDAVPGVAVLTPLRLGDGSAVLVDRGWAPSPDGYHVDLQGYREGDTVDVTGLGAVLPRGRGDADAARLADSLPYRIAPFVVQLVPSPGAPRAGLRRWPPPAITNGPHLGYAIQWFSFATIALVGTFVLLRTTRRVNPGATPRG
jgi:surfeit locus 1 family protein